MFTLIKFHKSYQLNYSLLYTWVALHVSSTANVARIRTLKRPISFNYSCGNSSNSRSPICGLKDFQIETDQTAIMVGHMLIVISYEYEAIFRCPPKGIWISVEESASPNHFRYPHFLSHCRLPVSTFESTIPHPHPSPRAYETKSNMRRRSRRTHQGLPFLCGRTHMMLMKSHGTSLDFARI